MNLSKIFKRKESTSYSSSIKYDLIQQRFIDQNISFLFSLQDNGKSGVPIKQSVLDNIVDISTNLIFNRRVELESIVHESAAQLPELKAELENTQDYYETKKYDLNKHDNTVQRSFFNLFRLYKTIKGR